MSGAPTMYGPGALIDTQHKKNILLPSWREGDGHETGTLKHQLFYHGKFKAYTKVGQIMYWAPMNQSPGSVIINLWPISFNLCPSPPVLLLLFFNIFIGV